MDLAALALKLGPYNPSAHHYLPLKLMAKVLLPRIIRGKDASASATKSSIAGWLRGGALLRCQPRLEQGAE